MATNGDTRSDESLPPTTSRRSDVPASSDLETGFDDLVPPFVPGRSRTAPEPAADEAVMDTPAPEQAAEEPAGEEPETTMADSAGAFDATAEAKGEEEAEWVGTGADATLDEVARESDWGTPDEEEAAFEEDVSAYAVEEADDYDDFPVESFDLEPDEAEAFAAPESADVAESGYDEWSPANLYGDGLDEGPEEEPTEEFTAEVAAESPTVPEEPAVHEAAAEEAIAREAEVEPPAGDETDDGPWAGAPASEPWGGIAARGTSASEPASAPTDNAEELAALLERLARLVREEGPEALRSEMRSEDRFNAALAGLLAGHLARP